MALLLLLPPPLLLVSLLLLAAAAVAPPEHPNEPPLSSPDPPNLHELECAVHAFAHEFGAARVPSASAALRDALNLQDCAGAELQAQITKTIATSSDRTTSAARAPLAGHRAASAIHVALTGSDSSGTGAASAPFATLARAQRAARAATKPAAVYVGAGKYYFNTTLALLAADSGVTWAAAPGAAGRVTLSGGVRLAPRWQPSARHSRIVVAEISDPATKELLTTEEERRFWSDRTTTRADGRDPPPEATQPGTLPHEWGAPPARWNTLHVDGVRQIRARFPNGNPQDNTGRCFAASQHNATEGCAGFLVANGSASSTQPGSANSTKPYRGVDSLDRNFAPSTGCHYSKPHPVCDGGSYGTWKYAIYDPPAGHPVYNKPMPGLGWDNNSLFSFWHDPFARPGGVHYGNTINKTYSNAGTGVIHMFHGALWGGWSYQLSRQDLPTRSLLFSHGGYQEARGSGITDNHYFVENLLEELDAPGEWFYDVRESKLYLWPNGTAPGAEVVAPILTAIVRLEGAADVTFTGFQFTETRATFLDQYEVPSGGDWAVHRGAALEIVDSSDVTVTNCSFEQVGGNGLLLSNNVQRAQVTHNEFVKLGDSAVVSIGRSNGIDGTAETYPQDNVVANNHMHEIGIYGKQTSCYFQALGKNTTLKDNVCYNGPRAGINWNDGFAGGSTVEGNLVFNMVRETGDHGPYNSWDRQPYLTRSGHADGYNESGKHGAVNASILKAHDIITKNFIINGYNGVWTIDHDDGSQYFNDTENFMVFGGCKNYRGDHKSCDRNVIVFPGIPSRAAGLRRCQTDDNHFFAEQYFDGNTCITQDGEFYSMLANTAYNCSSSAIDPHVYETWNNTLYSAGAVFAPPPGDNNSCATFAQWQAAGQDRGSKVLPLPSVAEIVALGKAVLGDR